MHQPTRARLIVIVLVLATCLTAVAQQPQPGPGVAVRGRVVSAETGAPLSRVHVALSAATLRENIHALTNESGEYELRDVSPGRYTVRATKTGFVSLTHGQRRRSDVNRPVVVTADGVTDPVNFALPRGGVIVVQVLDEFGDPLARMTARVEQRRFIEGERRLVGSGDTQVALVETDDRGEVRLPGLSPGEYYVAADMGPIGRITSDIQGRGYATTYYPGSMTPELARPVTVGPGQEVFVTIQMAVREPVARVNGVALQADGRQAQNVRVSLRPDSGLGGFTTDNPFSFRGLRSGGYTVEVGPNVTGAPSDQVGSAHFTVTGEDIADLVVTTRRGARIEGRIVFDSGVPTDLRANQFQLEAVRYVRDLTLPRFTVRGDWTFEGVGFNGSRTIRLRTAPEGWMLKSVILNGRDVTDTAVDFDALTDVSGVEVAVTRTQATVAGQALDGRGVPVAQSVAILFPEDRREWTVMSRFFGTAVADEQGRFTVSALPPSRYLVAAVDRLHTGEERDPELLERISRSATPLTLREGESRTMTLRVIAN